MWIKILYTIYSWNTSFTIISYKKNETNLYEDIKKLLLICK